MKSVSTPGSHKLVPSKDNVDKRTTQLLKANFLK